VTRCVEDEYPGPWTACPEADWVRGIVEAAGYRVAGDTGSAVIARGQGHSFYIWATRNDGSAIEGFEEACRVGNITVWAGKGPNGAMNDWRYWEAQGFVFWLSAGPRSTATSPDVCGLGSLVHQSQVQTPPSAG
jgi:hypothetical protein